MHEVQLNQGYAVRGTGLKVLWLSKQQQGIVPSTLPPGRHLEHWPQAATLLVEHVAYKQSECGFQEGAVPGLSSPESASDPKDKNRERMLGFR